MAKQNVLVCLTIEKRLPHELTRILCDFDPLSLSLSAFHRSNIDQLVEYEQESNLQSLVVPMKVSINSIRDSLHIVFQYQCIHTSDNRLLIQSSDTLGGVDAI